ncbi:MAG: hypothetical protein EHM89_12225 [Acidobacteria bacterium]|nr:MAG: hypothetical protein EHM89_12225 [Acidobacteriota bacterium]
MARTLGLALPLTVSLLLIVPARGNSDDPSLWFEILDEETFAAAGLGKLTAEELSVLEGVLIQPGGPSFLEREAGAYLERDGWRPVEVLAVMTHGWTHQIVVRDEEGLVRLEAWSSIEPLPPPGVHWAKKVGSWQILNPDGKAQLYSD